MTDIVLYALLVMLASLVGVFTVWKQAGKVIEKNLSFLVSFSAGVFLVITYQLAHETLEHASTPISGFIWVIIGALGIWLFFKFLPHFHHHHDEHEEDDTTHSHIDARRILVSDAIHNLGDGILLATAFTVSGGLGVATAISIFIHELVQEVSEFFVLRQAGYSIKRALTVNFFISGTILIGALGGTFLLDTFEMFEVPLLGIAAGSFFIVVLHDLIPHSVRASVKKTHYLKHALWFLVGLLLMTLVNTYTVHSYEGNVDTHEEVVSAI